MADILRIKRRTTGLAGAPTSLANAELAYNEVSHTLYYGEGTGGSGGSATAVVPIGGAGAFLPLGGGQLNGPLTLAADPAAAMQPATRQYVDARVSSLVATIAALRAATTATLAAGEVMVRSFAGVGVKGGGWFVSIASDTTSPDNTGTVVVDASGRRWYRLASQDGLANVQWWGVVGDGSTNDTTALNAALASGLSLHMPAGTYNVTAVTVAGVGQCIQGDGERLTIIRTTVATGDTLTITGVDIEICDIGFTASVTQTAGAFINMGNTAQVRIHDFYMDSFFTGVNIGLQGTSGGNTIYVERGELLTTVPSGYGVNVYAGVVIVLRDLLIEGNSATGTTQLTGGVNIAAVGDITLDHISTIWAGNGVTIGLPVNGVAQAVWIVNSFFDTGSGWGIYASATNDGSNIQLLKIADCWVATNTGGGIALTTGGTGVIEQVDILDTVSSNNTGHGIYIQQRCAHIRVMGCSVGSNGANGIWIDPNVNYFQILGNSIGASGEFIGNAVGLTVSSGCDNFTVADNLFDGNAVSLNYGTMVGVVGVSFWFRGNLGFITRYFGVLTTTAGPSLFTVTHGLAAVPSLARIRLTLGSGLGAASYFYPTNADTVNFQVAFDAAPGAGVVIFWEAHTLGD